MLKYRFKQLFIPMIFYDFWPFAWVEAWCPHEQTIRNEIGREFACSENIDAQIGRVLDRLSEMGELENTWIFYTADHGMAIGRHGLQGKQNLYEHTWRVPLIVKGPGVIPGSRAIGNTYLTDTLATLCGAFLFCIYLFSWF